MKEIRIEVPENQIDVLESFLDSSNLKSSKVDLIDGRRLFILKVEDHKSNNLLHELKARGIGVVFGNISIIQLALYMDSIKSTNKIQSSSSANIEEILANIEDSAVISGTYIALVILSGALAAFGLLENSVVIIIGSMIVAPLMGPIALTSIGVLLPQRGLLQKGLAAEALGILATIGIGLVVGLIFGVPKPIPEEMSSRAEANSLNVIFAIISAIAAGVIISKGQSMSIVGVAIAASLAPPAANIGLFLSDGSMTEAENAAILLLINILAINASFSIMFTIFRLPSKAGISVRRATRAQKINRIITTLVLLAFIVLSIILILQDAGE